MAGSLKMSPVLEGCEISSSFCCSFWFSGSWFWLGGCQVPVCRATTLHLWAFTRRVAQISPLVQQAPCLFTKHEMGDPSAQNLVSAMGQKWEGLLTNHIRKVIGWWNLTGFCISQILDQVSGFILYHNLMWSRDKIVEIEDSHAIWMASMTASGFIEIFGA